LLLLLLALGLPSLVNQEQPLQGIQEQQQLLLLHGEPCLGWWVEAVNKHPRLRLRTDRLLLLLSEW
jgi:hypothetical protein